MPGRLFDVVSTMPAGTEGTQRLGLPGKRGDEGKLKEQKASQASGNRARWPSGVELQEGLGLGGNPWEELGETGGSGSRQAAEVGGRGGEPVRSPRRRGRAGRGRRGGRQRDCV